MPQRFSSASSFWFKSPRYKIIIKVQALLRNESINRFLIIILLIKGAFPVETNKSKKRTNLISQNKSESKVKWNKSQHNLSFTHRASLSTLCNNFSNSITEPCHSLNPKTKSFHIVSKRFSVYVLLLLFIES